MSPDPLNAYEGKPTPGIEPGTPSLREKFTSAPRGHRRTQAATKVPQRGRLRYVRPIPLPGGRSQPSGRGMDVLENAGSLSLD
jgi:hypothetical protein